MSGEGAALSRHIRKAAAITAVAAGSSLVVKYRVYTNGYVTQQSNRESELCEEHFGSRPRGPTRYLVSRSTQQTARNRAAR
jgi:hypothetical protein